MNLAFRARRNARTVTSGPQSERSGFFGAWQSACVELRAAESGRADPDVIVRLATEVIRERNAMTRAQMSLGWEPSADVLADLERDEQLVRESDDRNL